MKPTLLAFALLLTSCKSGKYIGPRVDVEFGLFGASVKFVVWGDQAAKAVEETAAAVTSTLNPK